MWAAAGGGLLVAVAVLLLQLPVLLVDPFFVAVTTAATAASVALGVHLALDGERVTGAAFAIGGLLWVPLAVDPITPWGPIVAWASTGLPAVPLGIGILGYRRQRPMDPAERAFPAVALLLTAGLRIAVAPFVDATELGYPPGTWWPAHWAGHLPPSAAIGICRVGMIVLAVYLGVLGLRILRGGSWLRRRQLRPVLVPALLLITAVGVLQVVALLMTGGPTRRTGLIVAGVLVLGFTAGIPLGVAVRHLLGFPSARRLPRVRTPETAAAYVCELTGDPTAELLYCAPDGELLDGSGQRRSLTDVSEAGRFRVWVLGADGGRVGLLTAGPALWGDPDAVQELVRGIAVVAESARPSVLLRTRIAQLTALRVAEELAFSAARERFRRDLHDGLQQTIAAARMDLDGLHEAALGDAEAVVAGLEAKMATALAQVQTLGQDWSPPELESGLDAAIERAAAALRLRARVSVTGAGLGLLTLPVYYLVREALTNVTKHARAESVDVLVGSDGRTVEIVVSDDGRGGATAGPGIATMRSRIEELGGKLTLDSPPEVGTTLRASIPCV